MSFWDASALVPLLLHESGSVFLKQQARESAGITVWWGSKIECHSAIFRRHRSGGLDDTKTRKALKNFADLSRVWIEIVPEELVREEAIHLIRQYPLRAADALQLAAAIIWSNHRPSGRDFVCLDSRLRKVAEIAGFQLIPEKI